MNNINFITALRKTASQIAYSTPLYSWSLGEQSPDRLIVKPVDPWPGNAEKALDLLNAAGVGERTGPIWRQEWWSPEDADNIWHTHIHSFRWLRDLRTLGGPIAKEQGRMMIESWISRYENWDKQSWRSDLIGQRLAMWVSHFDYFCADQNDGFEDRVLSSLAKQARHLSHVLGHKHDIAHLETLKGLLYAGIAIEDQDKWINQAVKALEDTLKIQILEDGGHISRSPAVMLDVLEILVDIRSAFKAAAYTTPCFIKDNIASLSAALRTLRHRDRKLALFHGAQEGDVHNIDSILAQAGTERKTPMSLTDTGFERLEVGRGLLIIDSGKSAPYPYDKNAHASPLAFEFSYGKERVLSNCGSHPISEDWKDALRFTAAHNTACLDYRNACEIKKDDHFGRKITENNTLREETKDAILINTSHNGYVPLNGITHARTVYLGDEGHDLRGEDQFNASGENLSNSVELAIRFHIHPNVITSSMLEGDCIILRMPGGIGWKFKAAGADIKLEESLYVPYGCEVQKTKQIVISTSIVDTNHTIKWSLRREE